MAKVIFVGDPHLDYRTPISRLDDYYEVSIYKLLEIKEKALEHNVETIILLGDVFDKYEVSFLYLNKVLEVFKEFKEAGLNVYSIIGNHDLPYNNKRYFKQTPLSTLFQSGLVKHLTKLEIDNKVIYGLDFTEMGSLTEIKEDINKHKKQSILCMHYATDNTIPNESIERKDLQEFELVASGHDHMFYPFNETDKPIVLRPGSLVRRTRDAYNLVREPLIYKYNLTNKEITEIKLKVKPAEEVFKSEVMLGGITEFDTTAFSQVFNEAYFKKEALNLEDLIKDLPIDINKETKEYLINYFKSL